MKDNEHLHKQVTELKKEKSLMQQQVIHFQNKLNLLEKQVGLD
jgi:hypothetical protein